MKYLRPVVMISALSVLTFLGGLLIWDGFVMPGDSWTGIRMAGPGPAAAKNTFVPLEIQWLPWDDPLGGDRKVKGVSLGYFLQQKNVDGLSIGMVQCASDRKRAVSMSLVELSGDTNGFLMFLAGGSVRNRGCALGVWNMAEQNDGLQLGVFNQTSKDVILDYPGKPTPTEKGFGVQAGVVNYSEGRGVQIGLWNTNPNSWIKHFPIINFCF